MELKITYTSASVSELNGLQGELICAARERATSAVAPHSNFRVGAAARLEGGEILSAANIESEVYPAGICAERALLYFLGSNRPGQRIEAMAIVALDGVGECYPCGMCRQVMVDVERRQIAAIEVIMAGKESATIVASAADLLPFSFTLDRL